MSRQLHDLTVGVDRLGAVTVKATAAMRHLAHELRRAKRERRLAYAQRVTSWHARNARRTGRWPA